MRLVETVPHHTFTISIFEWNDKYILKIEYGIFEQVYKLKKEWVIGLEEIKKTLSEEFLLENLKRFNAMHQNIKSSLKF